MNRVCILLLAGLIGSCSQPVEPARHPVKPASAQRSPSCYAYYELESCDRAVAAARGDPHAASLTLADRSAALSKVGMSDRAEADCQEMLALNADAGAAWTACGYASFFAGRYEEALRRFDSAQPDASDPGAVSFGIAMTHYAMGQTHLAAQAFDKAIESKPKRPDYQFWRYMAWSELGNPDRTELDRHEAAYDWEISSMAIPMIDFQLGRGDEAYAWDHLDLYDDDRGITQATLRCFFEFNLAHKAMVAGNPQEALKHSDAGAAVCTPGEWAFHALKGLSRTLNARLGKA